jgi:Ca2+-binding RTX toxin-like protein
MVRGSHRFGSLLLALGALAAVPAPGSAVGAPPAAPLQTCLGKPATIVGQGTIRGTAKSDVIVGGPGADTILGGGGNDRICAGAGDDTVEGATGSDRIEAGAGDDEVRGGNGSDEVLAGPGDDEVFGERGNDRIDGGPGVDYLSAGLGDDTAEGGPGAGDEVIGGVGTDVLSGGPGDGDILEGDYGADTLEGGPGADDTVSYALAGSGQAFLDGIGVEVDLGAGTAEGDGSDILEGIEDVIGSPFADTIAGDSSPNRLYGGGGIDELTGVGPGDEAFGGSGLDLCRSVASADSCELDAPPGTDAIRAAVLKGQLQLPPPPPSFQVDLAGPTGSALTGIVEHGTDLVRKQGMQVRVDFLEGAWVVREQGLPLAAGEGCSMVDRETARCPIATTPTGLFLDGGEGGDLLAVEPSVPATVSARLVGGNGVDTLVGGAGADSLDGTLGFNGGDAVYGGAGEDALTGGSILDGQGGSDLLIALPCGEAITGGAGVDSVSFARAGTGVVATLGGSAGIAPTASFAGGCPTEHGGPPPSTIDGTVESIEGSPFDDVLTGDADRNIILGRGGDDEVHGAGGDDFLVGGEGVDALYGEAGADRLYARDGVRDAAIHCGPAMLGDVEVADPVDPPARGCADPASRRR